MLSESWMFAACEPESVDVDDVGTLCWQHAVVPGTVAENLHRAGSWTLGDDVDLDDREYWFRCDFEASAATDTLLFEGLATLADVWLNGAHILSTDNMFLQHRVSVGPHLRPGPGNTLLIRFASLNRALDQLRARAKWRTRLAAHRNLRFHRTMLLGRTPGICPPVAHIGPWRPVRLLASATPHLLDQTVRPRVDQEVGIVELAARLRFGDDHPTSAYAELGDHRHPLRVSERDGAFDLSGTLTLDRVERWWPHTHGNPRLYPLSLVVTGRHGEARSFELPPIGFRSLQPSKDAASFEIHVNGKPIHCRGGCWMPLDLTTLRASREALRLALEALRAAGMNMLRLSGVTGYESDDFYDLCDELGLLVWQDFPFASLDYPTEDADFLAGIEREAAQFLTRIGHRPSLAVTCGGSEILQQVTMLGLPGALADSDWFDRALPDLVSRARPDVIHCRHSPMGGDLPFHADAGVSHYFAVGGYRRPVAFAAEEPPRFASECLAFAIPPGPTLISSTFAVGDAIDLHKLDARCPRDNGSDWHFGEVTDYYLAQRFGVDPGSLRERDARTYLAAAGIAVGETMRTVVERWRGNGVTHGALLWTLRDVWPGAGWGIIDSAGEAKAPYYFLKRAWRPQALALLDRGTNGLRVVIHNDGPMPLHGVLSVQLFRQDGRCLQQASEALVVGAADRLTRVVDALLGGFVDSSYAYRFGPPSYDVAVARFESPDLPEPLVAHHTLAHAAASPMRALADPGLTCTVTAASASAWDLVIRCESFVQHVVLEIPGCRLSDNYFSLLPGEHKRVRIEGETNTGAGTLTAFTSTTRMSIELPGVGRDSR